MSSLAAVEKTRFSLENYLKSRISQTAFLVEMTKMEAEQGPLKTLLVPIYDEQKVSEVERPPVTKEKYVFMIVHPNGQKIETFWYENILAQLLKYNMNTYCRALLALNAYPSGTKLFHQYGLLGTKP
ncbi:MAG: hypothetical protein U0518_04745 [Candidatus Gracilibacteria bacterium]